ncbi:MAG: hypothetical protein GXP35_16645 [Actinobacteria bacterium]|nr:hypothetical protein [Actinomycetota bacterium]
MNEPSPTVASSQTIEQIQIQGELTPVLATPPPLQTSWWTRRRMATRSWDEQYKPAPLWKRIFAIVSLALIAVGGGLLMAGSVAAAIAAAAIAISSIVS